MAASTDLDEVEKAEIDVEHGIAGQKDWDSKWMRYLVSGLSIVFSITFLYTAGFGIFDLFVQRSTFLVFSLVLVFLLYPIRDDIYGHIIDAGVIGATLITNGYLIANYKDIAFQAGIPEGIHEVIFGVVLVLLVAEGCRRTIGWILPILMGIFIAYALWGNYLPVFSHRGYYFNYLIGYLYLTANGVWSFPIGIASTYIITFVIFGAFLLKSGISELFTNLAMRIAGRISGGPAQVAVFSSGLFGMVSGAAPANVATTGSVTIPMMKSIGFDSDFAGAVESSASAGGLIMPPIMGAAVFLMVEFTGIPYREIIVAATVPALLYYTGISASVYFVSKLKGIGGQSKAVIHGTYPHPVTELKRRGHLLIPVAVLVALVFRGWGVTTAAFWSIVLTVGITVLRSETRMWPKDILRSLDDGGRKILEIAMAVAAAGVIFSVVNLTGLGVKFSSVMLSAATISIVLALVMVMIGCIIMGMGLPATVAYLIAAAVAAPGLTQLGFGLMETHLFVFYFAILATVTPPVGLALYTAAAIAESNWLDTGIKGLKLTFAGFIVPFVFIYESSYLLRAPPFEMAIGILAGFCGAIALAFSLNYYVRAAPIRALVAVLGLAMFYPSVVTRIVGLVAFGVIFGHHFFGEKPIEEHIPLLAGPSEDAASVSDSPGSPGSSEKP